MTDWRTGIGYDAHRYVEGNGFVLGGVSIPFERGIAAHSDGDVLIHALCDALLGAGALGDIGEHFPPGDEATRGLDSRRMLRRCVALLNELALSVWHVDAVVVAEKPKMRPHIGAMRANLASDLSIPRERVSIKATTTEGMGFVGRVEGLEVQAVATVRGRGD